MEPAYANSTRSRPTLNHRDRLTSSPSPSFRTASPNPYAFSGGENQNNDRNFNRQLEDENESHLEGLNAKVKMLKDITLGIGEEVRDSTKFLDGMNDSFTETQGVLGGTFRRLNNMAKRQGGFWFYWMLFLILVGFIFFLRWLHII